MTLAASICALFTPVGTPAAPSPAAPATASPGRGPSPFAEHMHRAAARAADPAPARAAAPAPEAARTPATPAPQPPRDAPETPHAGASPQDQPRATEQEGPGTPETAGAAQREPESSLAEPAATEPPAWFLAWLTAPPHAAPPAPPSPASAEAATEAPSIELPPDGRTARDPRELPDVGAGRGAPAGSGTAPAFVEQVSAAEDAGRLAVEALAGAEQPPEHGPLPHAEAPSGVPSQAAPTAGPAHGAAAARALPSSAEAVVPAAVQSPEFGEALASQVAYLVRDGVQQARLQLHPAELGPLQVQIALQGQQAQIDFVAASAVTRAAIESSLSSLAATLQQAGFTLAGGGVFQGSSGSPHDRDDRGPGSSAPREVAAVEAGPAPAPRPVGWRAGGVDFYA
ncbi:flagellar hook-length control protein FliK [Caldimonas aquatica]|uniref:Flagellar hook-length control protein FliK n=1 Tax=Caldimonas aquatica TaxID=376175 RepID=A0ABY6MUN9_9BURK|nr:flagellar hook-length control protein FliK [Schlegelella aquatica]UZD55730.1 flagellar hook-length control protein FliK [Schlegelella aquatica]